MFRECEALLVNKVDLAPHLDVSLEKIRRDAARAQPGAAVFESRPARARALEGVGWLGES